MNKYFALAVFSSALIASPFLANAETLSRQLQLGMSGPDVSLLQTFLAKDPTIYPQARITGYFGSLTKVAVMNFQTRNGIEAVGRVGPATLPVINLQMNDNAGMDTNAPILSGISLTIGATTTSVKWNTNEQAAGIVYYSTSGLTMTDSITEVTIGGSVAMTDTALHTSQNVNISGLQPNTLYYYIIYTRDASGNVQVTWPTTFRTTN
jgi:peptidoglycan hydrolase-like protein with peptidoglycan-binding domain